MTMVLLNNVDHHDLRVLAPSGQGSGAATNQVLAFATEFEALQRHYPIVFRESTEGPLRPVAILGLARDQNLFLGERGVWEPDVAIPLALQRGPFAIAGANDAGSGPRVLVDLDHPQISRDAGDPVFLPKGGNAPYLERMLAILAAIYEGERQADALVGAFEKAGLLQPANLQVRTGEDEIYAISDVMVVEYNRIAGLSADALADLHRDGFLPHAIHAAASLGNLQRLAERKARHSRVVPQ